MSAAHTTHPNNRGPAKEAKTMHNDKGAYTVAEAAAYLGLGRTTVFEMLGDGRLKGLKLAGRRLIRKAELDRLLNDAEASSQVAA